MTVTHENITDGTLQDEVVMFFYEDLVTVGLIVVSAKVLENAISVGTLGYTLITDVHLRITRLHYFSYGSHTSTRGNGKRSFDNKEAVVVPPFGTVLGEVSPKHQRGSSHKLGGQVVQALNQVGEVAPFVALRSI